MHFVWHLNLANKVEPQTIDSDLLSTSMKKLVRQSHQLTKEEEKLSLNELADKYPYVSGSEDE